MSNKIDISGIDKAELLVALFTNAAPPIEIVAFPYSASDTLTVEEANAIFAGRTSTNPYVGQPHFVDYVKGRKLRINLGPDSVDPTAYDKTNGAGKAQEVISQLKSDESTLVSATTAATKPPAYPELIKLQAYVVREVAQTAVLTGEGFQGQLNAAQRAYENASVPPGNKNAFVPWSDPDIAFECDCGQLIYADCEHTH